MKGTNCNAGTNLTEYQWYFMSSITYMLNDNYVSIKYARPFTNIHKQLFTSKPPTYLNRNAKLFVFTISVKILPNKYSTKSWIQICNLYNSTFLLTWKKSNKMVLSNPNWFL